PVRSRFFRLLERWLARHTTALVAVSPQVRDDLVSLGVAPPEKFAVVRLGIELDERVGGSADGRAETRRYLGIPPDRFTVGWVGRTTAGDARERDRGAGGRHAGGRNAGRRRARRGPRRRGRVPGRPGLDGRPGRPPGGARPRPRAPRATGRRRARAGALTLRR